MITVTPATRRDLSPLLSMMQLLCAYHGDTCQMGLAEAQRLFFDEKRLIALIARHRGKTAGYAVIERRWKPTLRSDTYDIAHLYVAEPLRCQGIGRALIGAARDLARADGASRLTIGTAAQNPGAAAAYRSMGLEELLNIPGARFAVPL